MLLQDDDRDQEIPSEITTGRGEVRWLGDDLNHSPTALALLQAIPADFQATDELLEFFEGRQWEPIVRRHRGARPTLTINMLPRIYAAAVDAETREEDAVLLTPDQNRRLKCFIALNNRDAQMMFNYMASAWLERARVGDNHDTRPLAPEHTGRAAWEAFQRGADSVDAADAALALDQLEPHLHLIMEALEGAKAEMDAAVAAEREACAKIAASHTEVMSAVVSCSNGEQRVSLQFSGEEIATKIRARGEVKGEKC